MVCVAAAVGLSPPASAGLRQRASTHRGVARYPPRVAPTPEPPGCRNGRVAAFSLAAREPADGLAPESLATAARSAVCERDLRCLARSSRAERRRTAAADVGSGRMQCSQRARWRRAVTRAPRCTALQTKPEMLPETDAGVAFLSTMQKRLARAEG